MKGWIGKKFDQIGSDWNESKSRCATDCCIDRNRSLGQTCNILEILICNPRVDHWGLIEQNFCQQNCTRLPDKAGNFCVAWRQTCARGGENCSESINPKEDGWSHLNRFPKFTPQQPPKFKSNTKTKHNPTETLRANTAFVLERGKFFAIMFFF